MQQHVFGKSKALAGCDSGCYTFCMHEVIEVQTFVQLNQLAYK
jgi:hypothetical protein